jgi:hypothetical protein
MGSVRWIHSGRMEVTHREGGDRARHHHRSGLKVGDFTGRLTVGLARQLKVVLGPTLRSERRVTVQVASPGTHLVTSCSSASHMDLRNAGTLGRIAE